MQADNVLDSGQPKQDAIPLAWLTGELLLYGVLGLAALIARLAWLGRWPLRMDEAVNALAAWRSLHPGLPLPAVWSPLLVGVHKLIFTVFQASDFSARLLPALVGASLAWLPWHWRNEVGRIGALAAALLVTISPALLYFSRAADGIFLAGALCAWSFTLAYHALAQEQPRKLTAAAALLGLALAAAPNAYSWLVAALSLGGAYYFNATPNARMRLRHFSKPLASGSLWLTFAAVWFLGATAVLTNLSGLNQAANMPLRWLNGLRDLNAPWGFDGLLRNLAAYELLLLLIALYGAAALFKNKAPAARWLVGWLLALLVLTGFLSAGNPAWISDPLWPLLALAACGCQALWDNVIRRLTQRDLVILAPVLALVGFTFLQLVEYSRVPDGSLLAYAAVGLGLALIAWASYWVWSGRSAALRVGALVVLLLLTLWTVRVDSALLYQTGADPRESYAAQPTDPSLNEMASFLSVQSSHLWRDAHAAEVFYPAELDPLLGWQLRSFKLVQMTGGRPVDGEVIIMPAENAGEGPRGYIGQRFIMRREYQPGAVTLRDALLWHLLRQPIGAVSYEEIELWLAVPPTDAP